MGYIDITMLDKLFVDNEESIIAIHENGQIQKINKEAANFLKVDKNMPNQLILDESSIEKWDCFVKQMQSTSVSFCDVYIIVENERLYTRVIGSYHKEQKIIFARLITNPSINSEQPLLEKNQLFSVLNHVGQGVLLTDKNGVVIDVNIEVLKILGFRKSQIQHKRHEQLLLTLGFTETQITQYFHDIIRKSTGSIIFENKIPGFKTKYYELYTSIDFAYNLLITTFKDVTSKMESVDRKDSHLLSTMNQMVATIAHEIRNPMTSLKGFLQLLKTNTDEEGLYYFSIIDSEFERLEMILEEILYLSKPPQYLNTEVSLLNIVKQVIDIMQPQAIEHKVLLLLQCPPMERFIMFGHDARLKQLLINVIKNAIEVMPLGGTITITLNFNVNGDIEIVIKDEGLGMSYETKQALFTPFFTTKETGSGLGLPLVKKIITEHNGQVNVKSQKGVGTEFIFTIPIVQNEYLLSVLSQQEPFIPTSKRTQN
ncbi:HAMP domain-containing sensor histidine kinase [Solibacillus sp. CAU 1738]|uniref:HAMP domain-containing sensor histidine kinase n=1 Tax=Solibacillus sp. CAU 1738 TaxID=3140363 RepID=UPI003260FE29